MKRLRYIYIAFAGMALAFAGCDSKEGESNADNNTVYLAVTRATADGVESINADNTDYEDRVHDLAMLVFDSSTGNKVGEYYETGISMSSSNTFVVKLTPGTRNFYFIANMDNSAMQSIASESAMKAYMGTMTNLDAVLCNPGASLNKGFPMSRVYLNQTVTTGGSIYQPTPFKPGGEDRVKLIRVVAKLEVNLDGTADMGVKGIYFRNANRQFCLSNPSTTPPSTYFNDNTTDVPLKRVGTTNTYIYYMPEAIISSTTWKTGNDNKPINYFTIETNSGVKYDIPIISNEATITADYLKKATGQFIGFTPDYNILRNHHYKYTIKNLQKIEIIYTVNEWDKVEKSLYMGYGYNVEVDENGNVTITNMIDDCLPHKVKLVAMNGAYFGTDSSVITWEYGYTTTSDAGYSADKLKSGYTEANNINADGVASGTVYLEVFYNGVSVKTITKK